MLTAEEKNRYEDLLLKQKQIAKQESDNAKQMRALFSDVLVRALQGGKWCMSPHSTSYVIPADAATEEMITKLAREIYHVDYHDQIYIKHNDTILAVFLDDGGVGVELEFMTDEPEEIRGFCRSLHVDIDLEAWVALRRAEAVAEIDKLIAELSARKARYLSPRRGE